MTAHYVPTPRRFSVAEIEAMVAAGVLDEDERIELINGELVPMSPSGSRHEAFKLELLDRWFRCRPDFCRVMPETTFRLSEHTFLQPDVVVFTRDTGLDGLDGETALLVVEISDTSLRYDMGRKAALYASFGVRELWVIDVAKRAIHVFREPSADGYRSVQTMATSAITMPLFAPPAFGLRIDDLDI